MNIKFDRKLDVEFWPFLCYCIVALRWDIFYISDHRMFSCVIERYSRTCHFSIILYQSLPIIALLENSTVCTLLTRRRDDEFPFFIARDRFMFLITEQIYSVKYGGVFLSSFFLSPARKRRIVYASARGHARDSHDSIHEGEIQLIY